MAGLVPISLAVQVCSFISSIALARVLGASYATDAYFIALSIPTLVYGILLAAVRIGATPALTDASSDDATLDTAASELVSATFVASAVLTVVAGAVAATVLPGLLGASPHQASTTRLMILELTPLGVFGAMTGAL